MSLLELTLSRFDIEMISIFKSKFGEVSGSKKSKTKIGNQSLDPESLEYGPNS